jgi:hypothetical protein
MSRGDHFSSNTHNYSKILRYPAYPINIYPTKTRNTYNERIISRTVILYLMLLRVRNLLTLIHSLMDDIYSIVHLPMILRNAMSVRELLVVRVRYISKSLKIVTICFSPMTVGDVITVSSRMDSRISHI